MDTPSTNLQPHGNTFVELNKCSETPTRRTTHLHHHYSQRAPVSITITLAFFVINCSQYILLSTGEEYIVLWA